MKYPYKFQQQKLTVKYFKKDLFGLLQSDDLHDTAGHSHPADASAVEAAKIKIEIRQAAKSTKNRPAQILADAVSAADPPVRLHLSNKEVIKRSMRRCRRGALRKEPASSQVLLIKCELIS